MSADAYKEQCVVCVRARASVFEVVTQTVLGYWSTLWDLFNSYYNV